MKKKKFIFTEKLAMILVRLPPIKKMDAVRYAMNYGLGRVPPSDDPDFDAITAEINTANREKTDAVPAEDVREIIGHLNEVCGTSYRATSERTKAYLSARYKQGYTKEDCFRVIDKKAADWLGTKDARYLRPETLFQGKFEGYLNEIELEKSAGSGDASSFDTDDFFGTAMERAYDTKK